MVVSRSCPTTSPLLALLAALLMCAPSCDRKGERTPLYLRGLSDSTIYYLTHSDDSAFARYMRPQGYIASEKARRQFFENISLVRPDYYRRRRASILSCWRRLGDHAFRDYGSSVTLNEYHQYENLPPREVIDFYRMGQKLGEFERTTRLPAAEKLRALQRFLVLFEGRGSCYFVGRILLDMATCSADLDRVAQRILYHRALRTFEKCGEFYLRCQCLGELGFLCAQEGQADSMRLYYDEALRLARERRFPDQAPRIVSFYASYYAGEGRLGLAHELHEEAIRMSREYGGQLRELRFIRSSMRFHAEIGCWGVVSNLDDRALVLERLFPLRYEDPVFIHLIRLEEGRLRMAEGRVADAEKIYKAIRGPLKRAPQSRGVYPELLYFWGQGLLENGQPRRAIPRLEEGLRYAARRKNWGGAERIALLLAEAHIDIGRLEAAGRFLGEFDRYVAANRAPVRFESIQRDVLSMRRTLRETEGAEAGVIVPELSRALARFVRYLSSTDPSPAGYLWVAKAEEYRRMLQEVAGADAELGYGVELLWRDFYRLLGAADRRQRGDARLGNDVDDLASELDAGKLLDVVRARARSAQSRIAGMNAIHCLYYCGNSDVRRWIVTANGVRGESLPCIPDTLRRLAADAYAMLSARRADAEAPPETALTARLRRLAQLLLPDEVRREGGARSSSMLLVTADAFLEAVPFEALDTGDGAAYQPLLMRRDVAYLRFAAAHASEGPGGPGVILVNENASSDTRTGSSDGPRLAEAAREVAALAAFDRRATLLTGERATKGNLLSRWEHASYIYLATHTVRSPEAPYLMLIPLARERGSEAVESTNLDFLDVRSADLSRCELVVLSGCSTGAPYVERRAIGPALGDAFLDAGAASVVQTFWDVRDEDARALMSSFIRLWKGEGRSPIAALCEARRNAILALDRSGSRLAPAAMPHPAFWAAYSIKIGRL